MVELRQNDQNRNPSTVFVFKLVFTLREPRDMQLAVFHRFYTEVGRQPKQCLLHITTQAASVQVRSFSATILVSTNRDLRLTLDDAGIHYCPRYLWERTRYLGRFLELQRCGILPTVHALRGHRCLSRADVNKHGGT